MFELFTRRFPYMYSRCALPRIMAFCAVIMFLGSPAHPKPPEYKIYGILSNAGSAERTLKRQHLYYIAHTYKMVYSAPRKFFDQLHEFNADFENVMYVNTAELGIAAVEERNRRMDVLYYTGGVLAAPVRSADRTVRIRNGERPFDNIHTISASTATDACSSGCTSFVFWIRIGNELMRVNRVTGDPGSRMLHVARGFEKTAPADYEAGERVFIPCYRQSGYPGQKDGRSLLYFAAPGTTLRRDETVRAWEQYVKKGPFDGIWLDILGASPGVRRGKADGSSVRWEEMWDFDLKSGYTTKNKSVQFQVVRYNYKRLAEAVDIIHRKHGEYPVLYANNIWPWAYDASRMFFEPHNGRAMLKMYCEESSTSETSDAAFYEWLKDRARDTVFGEDITLRHLGARQNRSWLEYLEIVRESAYEGNAIGPINGKAGWKSQLVETLDEKERASLETFHYASYLLAVDPKKSAWCGTVTLDARYRKDKTRIRVPYVFPAWRWPLDKPIDQPAKNFENIVVHDTPRVYGRRFANGCVLVAPGTEGEATVDLSGLGGPMFDPLTGERHKRITLAAGSASILLKDIDPPALAKHRAKDDLLLVFNREMDLATLNGAVSISDKAGETVEGLWQEDGKNAYLFKASTALVKGAGYDVIVPKSISSLEGYSPLKSKSFTFTAQ
ncbi:MAG: Ig-like domain-containing protein [Kiritimatiellia bacterium]|nr:Ig-like domain-containing protein [Kiritimatiellia bacterium]